MDSKNMRNFKQFLTEATKAGFAPWHVKTPEDIKLALRLKPDVDNWGPLMYFGCVINKNGTVSIKSNSSSVAPNTMIGPIPDGEGFKVKLQTIKANKFLMHSNKVTNLWGFPDKVQGRVELESESLRSLDHLKTVITSNFDLDTPNLAEWGDCDLESYLIHFNDWGNLPLKSIGRHIKTTWFELKTDKLEQQSNKGLLGFCNMETSDAASREIPLLAATDDYTSPRTTPVGKAMLTIMQHQDVLDAKEVMMSDPELKPYAKL